MRADMVRIYRTPLLDGWRQDELRRLVELKRGYSWAKEQEIDKPEIGAVPVVRILNIQEHLVLDPMLYLRDVSAEDLSLYAVSAGWTLFVASNGNEDRIGDSALIEQDMKMVFASFLMGIKPRNPEELLPEFLAQWMRLHWVHELFSKTAQKGSGLGNFSWGAVKTLPLRYPDPDEQRRIVNAIADADKYVQLTTLKTPSLRSVNSGDQGTAAPEGSVQGGASDAGLGLGDQMSDAKHAELETALRLRFWLREELVSGERLLPPLRTRG